jgi:hypothetical protein
MSSSSSSLLSLSSDAFDAICHYLKRHHFVRLFLTGDAPLLRKIRELRTHPNFRIGELSVSSIETLMLLRPRHVLMDVLDSDTMIELAPSMSCLTSMRLKLGTNWLNSYSHLASLQSLKLDDYNGQALPLLPTTLTRLGWCYIYTGTQEPLDLSYLTNLTRLDTWNQSNQVRMGDFEYPRSLLVLKSKDVVHALHKLPETLTVLKLCDMECHQDPVRLSDLLKQFPDLNTLCHGSTLLIDVTVPPTLVKIVARFTNKDGNLLRTFASLPPTLDHFHFSYIETPLPLTNNEIITSLTRVLPGLNRKALFKFIRCLFRHSVLPLHHNNRKLLIDLANRRGFGGSGLITFLAMKVSLGELSLDITGEFTSLLLTHHYGRNNTITHYTPSQSRFFQTHAALEALIGEVLWMPNEEDCYGRWHLLVCFDDGPLDYAERIAELNVPIDVCAGCLELLLSRNQMPLLADIHCAANDGDSTVSLLHKYRSQMPRLERIRFVYSEAVHLSEVSIAKLRSMKLIEKQAATNPRLVCCRTFVYRVSAVAYEIEAEVSDEES